MTYEESKVMWQLEKMSFDEAKKNGNTTCGLNHLYHIADKLIMSNKLKYDEFCNNRADELAKVGNGEPEEVMNTVVTNLIDKYEQIS